MIKYRINLLGNTKSDKSVSMKIYAEQIFESLKRNSGQRFILSLFEPKDRSLPIIKNLISKDIYYPILAKFKSADINHITDHSYGLLALWLKPEKTIVTCHDLNPCEYSRQSSFLGKIRFWLNILTMKRAKNIIAVSNSTKTTILKHLNYKGTITVIHNGVNPLFGTISVEDKILVKNSLNISAQKKILLHIGSDYPVKNIGFILRILLKLDDFIFVKVGNFGQDNLDFISRNRLEDRIINLKNVSIEKLNEIYNIADIFIFPSFVEGFGLPILEAMRCGCPVICSNNSSLPEVGGDAARYFEANDELEAIRLIENITSNKTLRYSMIKNGFAQSEKFSWDKNALALVELYEKILNNKVKE